MIENFKAVGDKRGLGFRPAVLDNAGAYKHGTRSHELTHDGGEGNDNVGNDVCEHELVPAADARAESRVGDDIACPCRHFIRTDAIERSV